MSVTNGRLASATENGAMVQAVAIAVVIIVAVVVLVHDCSIFL